MYNFKNILLLIALCSIFSFASCSLMSTKESEMIQGKDYLLQLVYFHQKGANNESILKAMHSIEIPKIMRLLEHKYDINVDCTEFEIFLLNDDASKIKADGLLTKTDFSWESPAKLPNRIEYRVSFGSYGNAMDTDKSYMIVFFVDNQKAAHISGNFSKEMPTLEETAGRLRYKQAEGTEELYANMDTGKNIDLNAVSAQKMEDTEFKKTSDYITKQKEVHSLIKSQVETLPNEHRKRYKNDIIDYLNEIIQE